jgi:SpoVK/Ycf46/Vps4 family AAA+-type ATPase
VDTGVLGLSSELLRFDASCHHLLIGDAAGVSVIDLGHDHTTQISRRGVRSVLGFRDQVWLVAGDELARFDLEGRPIGELFVLPAGDSLVAAPCGPPGAIWMSNPPIGVVDDLGALAQHTHGGDVVIPFTARRAITIVGTRIQMPSGVVPGLPGGSRVIGGAVLADGRFAVLVAQHAGRRTITFVALANGQVVARIDVPAGTLRLASKRGILIVQTGAFTADVIDLRVGRELGSFVLDRDVTDLAIDADGRLLAIRRGADVELVGLADLLRTPDRTEPPPLPAAIVASTESPVQLAPEVNGVPMMGPDDGERAKPLVQSLPVAFAPRHRGVRLARPEALASLEIERGLILARGLLGIAKGWDTRRLGYANESGHPFELEVAALLGASQGHAESHVAEAQRRLELARGARTADRERNFVASPLGELAHEIGLTPLDVDILIAIAAPTLWGEIARLYAVLANDTGRGVVDELLVTQMLDAERADRYEIAGALAPDATLRRHGLVLATGDRMRPFTHLAINPIVAARLCVEPLPLPDVICVREAATPLDELVVPIGALERILAELSRPTARPSRLAVRGRRGSGRRSVLAAIAARANRALGVIDLGQLPSEAAAPALRVLLRSASLCGLVPCLAGAIAGGAEATGTRAISDAIAAHPGPITAVLGTDEASPFAVGHLELVLPALSSIERLQHWARVLARHELGVGDPEALSSRYRLTPGIVERAAVQVAQLRREDGADATRELEEAIRQGRDERLARLATRVTRLPRWSDVVLPPDVLDSLRELIGRVQHGRRVYEDWGFDAVMTTGRGLTALFDGRPGTGKTMVAGIIARELGLDLYRIDVSRLVSKWIGETEKNLAEIFDAVDDGQAIILFDEADSLFARRTDVRSSNDRYANLEVNYLLQRIDSFDGIAILTTNFGSAIDPAFRRRVSFRLSFPFPDEEAREQLWRVHLPSKLPIDGELNLGALARKFQLAGGYIRNACLRAAFLAAQEETTLAQRHLERAVQLEYQQVGKISTSGPVD